MPHPTVHEFTVEPLAFRPDGSPYSILDGETIETRFDCHVVCAPFYPGTLYDPPDGGEVISIEVSGPAGPLTSAEVETITCEVRSIVPSAGTGQTLRRISLYEYIINKL